MIRPFKISISDKIIKNISKKIDYKKNKWKLTFSDGDNKSYDNLILTCPYPQLIKLAKKFGATFCINNSKSNFKKVILNNFFKELILFFIG